MSSARVLESLTSELGRDAVDSDSPISVDGESLAWQVRPRNGEELARALALLETARASVRVCGGGSRPGLGNPMSPVDGLLSTKGLDGVTELDAEDGVVHVRAGTRLADLRDRVRAEGWELPLDPPGVESTVGGVLASGASGPRLPGFGPPRDCVLGLGVCLAGGARTKCGGRVVKNVTGFDMAKLYTGSLGTLGVIEAAWLRLRPRPAAVTLWGVALSQGAADLGDSALALSRLPSARMAVLLDSGAVRAAGLSGEVDESDWLLAVELAGHQEATRRDAERLSNAHRTVSISEAAVEAIRNAREDWSGAELRARISLRPSRVGDLALALASSGARIQAQPSMGLVDAAIELGSESPVSEAARAADAIVESARRLGGQPILESLPAEAKRGRDVFGLPPQTVALMRALKVRFDPHAVLNPGRFAEGV